MSKEKAKEQQQKVLELVQRFCAQKLNEEYLTIAKKIVAKLGRKRSLPLSAGKPEIWAAGVINAMATVNFLFDKSNKLYFSTDELNTFFGTSKTTTGMKAKEIRDMLKMDRFNDEFSTQELVARNPFNNMVMVNGYYVPIEMLPPDTQELIRAAKAAGVKNITLSSTPKK